MEVLWEMVVCMCGHGKLFICVESLIYILELTSLACDLHYYEAPAQPPFCSSQEAHCHL